MTKPAAFSDSAEIDEEVIAQARGNLKQTYEDLSRATNLWLLNLEEIKKNSDLAGIDQSPDNSAFLRKDRRIPPKVISKPEITLNLVKGVGLLSISALVILQELFLAFGGGDDVLLFSRLKEALGGHPSCVVLMITLVLLVQGYIITVTNYSVFRQESVKLALGNTSMNTMLLNSRMSFSLAFPLAYNTLMLFDETKEKETHKAFRSGFTMFYDPITKIPVIGPYYNYIVPLLLLLVIGIQVVVKVRERLQRGKGLSDE